LPRRSASSARAKATKSVTQQEAWKRAIDELGAVLPQWDGVPIYRTGVALRAFAEVAYRFAKEQGRPMDKTKPHIIFERGASGDTGAIHLVMPDGTRLGVVVKRTEENAAAFDYFSDKLRNGVNL
jgi:hypothetical protein